MDFAADLVALYADFGVTVTRADTTTFRGVLDQPTDDWLGMVRAAQIVLRCAASESAAEGATLTIGGLSYQVAGPARQGGDGLEQFVPLWEA